MGEGKEPYYPINDPKNDELFDKYERRALEEKNVLFGGRLGMYRYMDMDKVIEEALNMAETELTYEGSIKENTMDTPTITQYYRESDPARRLAL